MLALHVHCHSACYRFVLIIALASEISALLMTLKMEAAGSSEKFIVPFYCTTWRHTPYRRNLHIYLRENLKPHTNPLVFTRSPPLDGYSKPNINIFFLTVYLFAYY
jgi:hypothetical protein